MIKVQLENLDATLHAAATTIAAEKATVARVRRAMVTATGNRCGHVVICEASVLSPFHALRLTCTKAPGHIDDEEDHHGVVDERGVELVIWDEPAFDPPEGCELRAGFLIEPA